MTNHGPETPLRHKQYQIPSLTVQSRSTRNVNILFTVSIVSDKEPIPNESEKTAEPPVEESTPIKTDQSDETARSSRSRSKASKGQEKKEKRKEKKLARNGGNTVDHSKLIKPRRVLLLITLLPLGQRAYSKQLCVWLHFTVCPACRPCYHPKVTFTRVGIARPCHNPSLDPAAK